MSQVVEEVVEEAEGEDEKTGEEVIQPGQIVIGVDRCQCRACDCSSAVRFPEKVCPNCLAGRHNKER